MRFAVVIFVGVLFAFVAAAAIQEWLDERRRKRWLDEKFMRDMDRLGEVLDLEAGLR